MDLIVDGQTVHSATGSREGGADEPVVIMIHGAGMDRTVWQLQARNIAFRKRRLLAVDLPGHGRSEGDPLETIADMADWITRFMDAGGIASATLIGHSMGALVALEAAARHPGRVEKLVLMGVAETMPVHPDLLNAARENKLLAPELIIFWGMDDSSKVGGHPEPGFWVRGVNQTLLELSRSGVLGVDLAACNDYDGGREAAAKTACPALFILGRQDKMTPAKKGAALAEAMADARTVVIEHCGHMMMNERPNEVHDAFKGFVF